MNDDLASTRFKHMTLEYADISYDPETKMLYVHLEENPGYTWIGKINKRNRKRLVSWFKEGEK